MNFYHWHWRFASFINEGQNLNIEIKNEKQKVNGWFFCESGHDDNCENDWFIDYINWLLYNVRWAVL